MTPSSAQRLLRLKLGPHIRVIARPDDVRVVHEENGQRHVLGRGLTVDDAVRSLMKAAADVVGAKPAIQVRATVRSPWQAFVLAVRMLFASLFGRKRE